MVKSSASKLRCVMVLPSTAYSNYRTRPLSGEGLKAEKRQAIKPKGEKKLKNKKKRAIFEVCLVEEELNKVQEAQSTTSYLQDGVKAVEEKLEQINLFSCLAKKKTLSLYQLALASLKKKALSIF